MYRYQLDNVITYTSEDLVLFRESPFACWMERLTLENPGHGIPPDVGTSAPHKHMERQDEIADTLRSEGRAVALIDWEEEEPRRRAFTLDAMRSGIDFIVNGQLALGSLSGSANLLMRTSGYSELGDFLYIPCDTQTKTTLHCAFRLCFLSDLLHSLQGQLPPQMLIIRGGSDVVPLQCEDHIYHYRAVKQRFMDAMRNFRKHRMPDPAESSHFGRWADCANEVLKQRALRCEQTGDAFAARMADERAQVSGLHAGPAAAGSTAHGGIADGFAGEQGDAAAQAGQDPLSLTMSAHRARARAEAVPVGVTPTLAEQARMLDAGVYQRAIRSRRPGFTPNLAELEDMADASVAGERAARHQRRKSDLVLENLAFVGRSLRAPVIRMESAPDSGEPAAMVDTPAVTLSVDSTQASAALVPQHQPSGTVTRPQPLGAGKPAAAEQLRAGSEPGAFAARDSVSSAEPLQDDELPAFAVDCEPPPPTLKPPSVNGRPQSVVGAEFPVDSRSIIDMDDSPLPSPGPVPATAHQELAAGGADCLEFRWRERRAQHDWREQGEAGRGSFGDVLLTGDDYLAE
ncbi:MAG: hypothetical protein KDI16_01270 [Halioglobus sp.]|nr:hypothetical protein [Halioglobus sp.]